MPAFLIPWLWRAGAALGVLLMLLAMKTAYDRHVTAPYREKLDTWERLAVEQKREAGRALQAEIDKNAATSAAWTQYAKDADETHEKNLAAVRAYRNAAPGVRFLDPGRGACGGGAAAAAEAGARVTEAAAAEPGRISNEARDFLLGQAALADELAVYAATCHAWVNRAPPPTQTP